MNDFVTLCSNSQYFKLHPEKQAGIEKKTTSLAFPYTIDGTKDDVLQMFSFLDEPQIEDISLIEIEAEAKLKLLELMKL